jgi:hypothetical protein
MMPDPPPARKRDLFLLARLITILSICHWLGNTYLGYVVFVLLARKKSWLISSRVEWCVVWCEVRRCSRLVRGINRYRQIEYIGVVEAGGLSYHVHRSSMTIQSKRLKRFDPACTTCVGVCGCSILRSQVRCPFPVHAGRRLGAREPTVWFLFSCSAFFYV